MSSPAATTRSLSRQKKVELLDLLNHLELSISKKLPPLVIALGRGCSGQLANRARKEIAAIRGQIKRVNPEVMKWGSTADRLRYQNLMHNFDAQLRSADLRRQDQERRRFTRIDVDLPVTVGRGEASRSLRAVNMSPEGVRLQGTTSPQVGETVVLDLDEGPSGLGRLQGKVVWSHDSEGGGSEVGVRFLGLEETDKEAIRRYLVRAAQAETAPAKD